MSTNQRSNVINGQVVSDEEKEIYDKLSSFLIDIQEKGEIPIKQAILMGQKRVYYIKGKDLVNYFKEHLNDSYKELTVGSNLTESTKKLAYNLKKLNNKITTSKVTDVVDYQWLLSVNYKEDVKTLLIKADIPFNYIEGIGKYTILSPTILFTGIPFLSNNALLLTFSVKSL